MRRKEKEITEIEEIKKILLSAHYITIAMCSEDIPYLVTLNHGYDTKQNCLYFHGARQGKKMDFLRSNNKIWGQAILDLGYVDGKCDQRYASVHFQGRVRFVDDFQEKKHALEIMIRQLEKNPKTVMKGQLTDESIRKVTIGRIDIEGLFGKKSPGLSIPG